MKIFLKRTYRLLKGFGIDPILFLKSTYGLGFYFNNYFQLRRQNSEESNFRFGSFYPILDERFSEAGTMSGHYFHQDLFVAKQVFKSNPQKHLDIGSRTDGFVAHVAVFREIEVMDIREQSSSVNNIIFKKADLMQLPKELISTYDSISTLHAIEHFGLGRYGDPIDINGYLKAIQNITQMLLPKGTLYFSVPIGPQRIEFNAHRVFSVKYIFEIFKEDYNIIQFSYVDDKGDFYENTRLNEDLIEHNYGCNFGCGIFQFEKKSELKTKTI